MSRKGLAALGIVAACLLCYGNSLQGSFHYDDFHSIVDNPGIRTLANLPRFFVDPEMFSADAEKRMYRPLLLSTYALNYAWGEYEVSSYHLVNLSLHALCSLLVWGLAAQLHGGVSRAFFCGLLFAAHPLGSEPVNYISSRSELLMAVFFLASCLAYIRFIRSGGGSWDGLALGAAALALLSKSVAVVLVFVLPLCDWYFHGRAALLQRWKYYLPFVFFNFLYILFSHRLIDAALNAPVRPLSIQIWTQAKALVYYLKLLFMPHGLNVEHQFFAANGPGDLAVAGGLALVASLGVLAWRAERFKTLVFGLAWGALTLLPATLTPLNMLVNERRLYLVVAGFVWAVVGLCGNRIQLGILVLLCGLLGTQRNEVWQDELSLWRDAVRKAPQMYRAQTNLGKALQLAGEGEAALRTYQAAIAIDPRHGDAYNNIATIFHQQSKSYGQQGEEGRAASRLEQAIQWYNKALKYYPGYEEIHQNLGDAHAQRGQLDQALASYERALEIDARSGMIWNNYGQALSRSGRRQKAEGAFAKAIELLPEQAEPYNNMGNIFAARKEYARAVEMYRKALEFGPRARAEILANLGDSYRQLGLLQEARARLQEAIKLEPGRGMSYFYLGQVERAAGQGEAALAAFEQALSRNPDHARTQVERAEVLSEAGLSGPARGAFRRALEIDPNYSRAWHGLARILEREGSRREALQAYRTFVAGWPHRDQRYRRAQERIAQLEMEP